MKGVSENAMAAATPAASGRLNGDTRSFMGLAAAFQIPQNQIRNTVSIPVMNVRSARAHLYKKHLPLAVSAWQDPEVLEV